MEEFSAARDSDELVSLNDNGSLSMKDFVNLEKCCENQVDEEIRLIFGELNKLSGDCMNLESDDVESILKKAEDIAHKTENLFQSNCITMEPNLSVQVPKIKVTASGNATFKNLKPCQPAKHQNKENVYELCRKTKGRPFSAGAVEVKKKQTVKSKPSAVASKKPVRSDHASLEEELKDTNERVKSLELSNVQLTEDNKALRKRLIKLDEDKHAVDLKLVESEKFISRLSKEYDNRTSELQELRQNESKILAELHKERSDKKGLSAQHEKDVVAIQDLQRQVKEMEMILRRKHPDSVSALIVASKSSALENNKKKLLEERIARLEQELKDKENHFQSILLTLQEKFGDMKRKYENHIIDIERQLMEDRKLRSTNKADSVDAAVQTCITSLSKHTQTAYKPERVSSAVAKLPQNSAFLLNKLKEDTYLIATIKGLQSELAAKQKAMAKINRETEDLRKNLRSLQKEKEVLLNLNPQRKIVYKHVKSVENINPKINSELETELTELRKHKDVLIQERKELFESLKNSNEDFIALKKKRIQDLHTLQLTHEKELMQMNMQLYPLQEEIKILNRTVDVLQERIKEADEKMLKYQAVLQSNGGGDCPNISKNKNKRLMAD